MDNQIQTASKLRDLAAQIALNFAGHPISSSDGSYNLLIQVIYDAMLQVDREARDDEREACASILDSAEVEPYCGFQIAELAGQIRARSESLLYRSEAK